MGVTNFDIVQADSFIGQLTGLVPAPISDPGDAGAIPATASGEVALETAAPETRTLANPAFVGQRMLMYLKTDGGDCVVTVADAFDAMGHTVITFDDEGDSIELVAIEVAAGMRWRVSFLDNALDDGGPMLS